MARVTTSILPPPVQIYYDRLLLAMAQPNLIHTKLAMKKNLAARSGDKIRMERYDDLSVAKVPLGNTGVTPPNSSMSSVYIDAELSFYGQWVEVNDQVDLTSQSPVLNERARLLGRSMRFTEDELIRDYLSATAFVINSVGGVNGDAPTEMALTDVQDVVKSLMSNDAKTVADSIDAANKFGTSPVPNAYVGLGHTDLLPTLENMNGWVSTEQYSSQKLIDNAEVGKVNRVRFLLSSKGSVSANASGLGEDVYNTFICGMEAYTTVGLENANAKFIYHDYKIAGGPLELNSTAGWKMSMGIAITNDAWIANLKSTLA